MPCKKTRKANGLLLAAANALAVRCSAVLCATPDGPVTHNPSNRQPTPLCKIMHIPSLLVVILAWAGYHHTHPRSEQNRSLRTFHDKATPLGDPSLPDP